MIREWIIRSTRTRLRNDTRSIFCRLIDYFGTQFCTRVVLGGRTGRNAINHWRLIYRHYLTV
jgi:hypothetical protein